MSSPDQAAKVEDDYCLAVTGRHLCQESGVERSLRLPSQIHRLDDHRLPFVEYEVILAVLVNITSVKILQHFFERSIIVHSSAMLVVVLKAKTEESCLLLLRDLTGNSLG